MKRTNFKPKDHAFRFANRFVNKLLTFKRFGFWGKTYEIATEGRCGGMAFAALDYYFENITVPDFTAKDFPDSDVPPDTHPLAKYIYSRQIDSMIKGRRGAKDGWKFLRWTQQSTETLIKKTIDNEIPKVKQSIDKGKPVVLGLVKATQKRDIGNNHQVVCFAYNDHPSGHTDLYIYDPNHPPGSTHYPSGEVLLSRRIRPEVNIPDSGIDVPGDPSEPIKTITTAGYPFKTKHAGTWRGFFVQGYSRKSSPPRFGRAPQPAPGPGKRVPPIPPVSNPGKGGKTGELPGTGRPPVHLN